MRQLRVLLLASTAAVALFSQTSPPKTHLKVGDEAPDFRGKKNVVLAFFPAAFTGG